MQSKNKKYAGIAELIKDFVHSHPKDKLDFRSLTKLVLEQYPKTAWKKNWDQWRYHTTHRNGNYYAYFTRQEREALKKMFSGEKYFKLQKIDNHRRKFWGRIGVKSQHSTLTASLFVI